jgi:hypothetical protein
MHEKLAEKFAELFAECATTGNTAPLQKEAAAHSLIKKAINPLYAGAGGALVGGAAGYLGTKKQKDKLRNALYGAAISGLGSAGGAAAYNTYAPAISSLFSSPAGDKADKAESKGDGDKGKPGEDAVKPPAAPTDLTTHGTGYAGAGGRAVVAGGAGAYGGQRLGGYLTDRFAPGNGRRGELKRLADMYDSAGGGKGGGPARGHARALNEILEAERIDMMAPGQPANALRSRNYKGQTLGGKDRTREALRLADAMNERLSSKQQINRTGTLLTDLDKVRGRKLHTTNRVIGGTLGGLGGNLAGGWLQNIIANYVGAAPKPTPEK